MGEKAKKDFIRDTIKDKQIDFVGLQETMRTEYPDWLLNALSGDIDFEWILNPSRGRSGGILVGLNKNTFDIVDRDIGKYFTRALLVNKANGLSWNLVIVYGDA